MWSTQFILKIRDLAMCIFCFLLVLAFLFDFTQLSRETKFALFVLLKPTSIHQIICSGKVLHILEDLTCKIQGSLMVLVTGFSPFRDTCMLCLFPRTETPLETCLV